MFKKRKTIVLILTCSLVLSLLPNIHSYASKAGAKNELNRNFAQADPYIDQMNQLKSSFLPQTVYYFSTSGSDSNDGLSASTPKQNPVPYISAGNCKCLLKSGDVFSFQDSINVGTYLVLSTYGGSTRAGLSFIINSDDQLKLSDPQNSIYSLSLNSHNPDTGWISIDGEIYWKRLLSNSLTKDKEYYVDKTSHMLYIKSTSKNLEGKTVRYSLANNGLSIINRQKVLIENMEIAGAGSHGISIMQSSSVLVNNCYIHDIGGSIHASSGKKYGNGIQIWANNCNDIGIYKNIITNCFDAGLTTQIGDTQQASSTNHYFVNNLVESCCYGFECFHTSKNYPLQNVVVSNNIFSDMRDITEGYRLTVSSTDYIAFLCLWDYVNPNSNILIDHNFGYKSQGFAISYSWKDAITPPISFSANTLISTAGEINYPQHYTGDASQYAVVGASSAEAKKYQRLTKTLSAAYSKKMLIKP